MAKLSSEAYRQLSVIVTERCCVRIWGGKPTLSPSRNEKQPRQDENNCNEKGDKQADLDDRSHPILQQPEGHESRKADPIILRNNEPDSTALASKWLAKTPLSFRKWNCPTAGGAWRGDDAHVSNSIIGLYVRNGVVSGRSAVMKNPR